MDAKTVRLATDIIIKLAVLTLCWPLHMIARIWLSQQYNDCLSLHWRSSLHMGRNRNTPHTSTSVCSIKSD